MATKNPAKDEKQTPSEEAPPPENKPKDPVDEIWDTFFSKTGWDEAEKVLKKNVPRIIQIEWEEAKLSDYNPIFFLDQSNSVGEEHADRIYSALCGFKEQKNIMLIIGSRGGRIEPAYLISKNCKAVSKNKFVAVIPRRAKSAATLMALGADEIHMGSMSELGPIDPQFRQLPALSLTNALETIAKLVTAFPKSADMFSKFLESQLNLGMLGYFERINESAVQYASRLLNGKKLPGKTPQDLAEHLVNHYKDHSFVIDKDEALSLFGEAILKVQTDEYKLANRIDTDLRLISRLAKIIYKKVITFVGSPDDCVKVRDLNDDED